MLEMGDDMINWLDDDPSVIVEEMISEMIVKKEKMKQLWNKMLFLPVPVGPSEGHSPSEKPSSGPPDELIFFITKQRND